MRDLTEKGRYQAARRGREKSLGMETVTGMIIPLNKFQISKREEKDCYKNAARSIKPFKLIPYEANYIVSKGILNRKKSELSHV